jgi:hypothetical protein
MKRVFVPKDLTFMRITPAGLTKISLRLVPV